MVTIRKGRRGDVGHIPMKLAPFNIFTSFPGEVILYFQFHHNSASGKGEKKGFWRVKFGH